jgi:hypothetical protein
MLAYAYRNQRPFRTHRIGKPGRITAIFPSLVKFVSEDTEVHLRASGAPDDRGRQVVLDVSFCLTWFEESGRGVLDVSFTPAPDVELNEYDLLKFVKLWEGGECITPPIAFSADGEELGQPWSTPLFTSGDSTTKGRTNGKRHFGMSGGSSRPVPVMPRQITCSVHLNSGTPEYLAVAQNGGSLRERAKARIALRDGFPVSFRPRLAELRAPD